MLPLSALLVYLEQSLMLVNQGTELSMLWPKSVKKISYFQQNPDNGVLGISSCRV